MLPATASSVESAKIDLHRASSPATASSALFFFMRVARVAASVWQNAWPVVGTRVFM